jgi:uncharacterized membrane protein YhhN
MRAYIWLVASLIFGIGYWLGAGAIPAGPLHVAVKMGGVGCLALHAWQNAHQAARPIALVMALGALGDGLIELDLIAGALAFLAGHLVACKFYWRWLRPARWSDRYVAVPLLGAGIAVATNILSHDSTGAEIYALGLAAMVAFAWMSDFPRYLVALGAMMFAVSDLLLFARMGVLAASPVPGLLIWPLYYAGQMLITLGVVGYQGRRMSPWLLRVIG